jgi:hypothetical protein
MKTTFTFLISLSLGLSSLKSQVVLTQSNHSPVPGDVQLIKEFDTTANIVNILNVNGNNVLYDFSQKIIHGNNTFTNTYVTPSVLPGSNSFISMGANVALSDSGGFYKSSSSSFEFCGQMSASGHKMELNYDKATFMNYPFSYNSFFTDVAQGTMSSPIFPPFNLTATISCSGMGQGTLQLPGNSPINNVLLVKRSVNMLIQGTGSLSTVTGTQTINQYEFYKSGSKFPVMRVQYVKASIPALGVNNYEVDTQYDGSIILNTNNFEFNKSFVNIYPQPANNFIVFSGSLSYADYIIYDVNGNQIKKGSVYAQEPIDVSRLQSGLYLIEFRSNGAMCKKKIIKN